MTNQAFFLYNQHMADFKAFGTDVKNSSFYKGSVLFDEPMYRHTTFKIGGPAPVFFEPENNESVLYVLKECRKNGIPFFILGGGSNIVFCDSGFDGAVLSTSRLNEIKISKKNIQKPQSKALYSCVQCQAGCTVAKMVNFCTENDLWGAQQFSGLPGSAGGALFMNARCFDRSISDIFLSAEYIDLDTLEQKEILFNESQWDYKVSPFQDEKKMILSATFSLESGTAGNHQELLDLNRHYIQERKDKGHFNFPSAGSVFRNNRDFGKPSGMIIDECGLRGKQIGRAQVAPFHGNFIINLGGATQKDVKTLVEFVVNTVREKTGLTLQTEIIFVG